MECYVCREIAERSAVYERWLFAENFGDGATLHATGAARGYCTFHAARIVRRDATIAGPIAAFVLRAIDAELGRQLGERHGYRDALDPRARCPWCQTEIDALEYALSRKHSREALCQPHAQDASQLRSGRLVARSPLAPGTPLDQPQLATSDAENQSRWWSRSIETLVTSLEHGACPACEDAARASERREAFYRIGPRPNEHWEAPRLCRLHDAQLGQPRGAGFDREPDGLDRLCDWCAVMERAAHRGAELLALAYREAAFQLAYARSRGFCLVHAAAALHHLRARPQIRDAFAEAVRTRIATMVWELDERAARRSWNLRDQGEPTDAATLSHRAWWLVTGGTFRFLKD